MSQQANSTLPPINQDAFEVMLVTLQVAPIQTSLQIFLEFVFLMFLVGLLFGLSLFAMCLLIRRRGFRRLSVNLLLATLITLNMSTGVYVGAQLIDFIVTSVGASAAIAAQIFSPTYTGYPSLARDYDLEIFASALTLVVNMLLSDCVVWWRAIAIWPDNIFVKGAAVLLVVPSLILGIIVTYRASPADPVAEQGPLTIPLAGDPTGLLCVIFSLLSNVFATSIIAHKTWEHWRLVRMSPERKSNKSQALSALVLLVESGLAYSLFWVVVLAGTIISYKESNGSLDDTPTVPAANFEWFVDEIIVETFLVPLIAIYPVLVILIVAMKVSPIDGMSSSVSHSHLTTRPTSTGPSGNSRSIIFAPVSSDVESNNITLSAGAGVLLHQAEVDSLKEKPQ